MRCVCVYERIYSVHVCVYVCVLPHVCVCVCVCEYSVSVCGCKQFPLAALLSPCPSWWLVVGPHRTPRASLGVPRGPTDPGAILNYRIQILDAP